MRTKQEAIERVPQVVLEVEAILNRVDGTLYRHDTDRRLALRDALLSIIDQMYDETEYQRTFEQ